MKKIDRELFKDIVTRRKVFGESAQSIAESVGLTDQAVNNCVKIFDYVKAENWELLISAINRNKGVGETSVRNAADLESAGGTVQNSESESIEAFMNKATEEKAADKSSSETDEVASGYDEMLPQAVEVVLEMGSCSVSMLQRRIKLGYSRAARIVDQMEELGVVGPYEGAKPRSLKIDRAGWQELKVRLGFAGESDLALAEEMNRATESENY